MNEFLFDDKKFQVVWDYVENDILLDENLHGLFHQLFSLGKVYLVGGAIKDIAYLGESPKDYDFIVISSHLDLLLDKGIFSYRKNSFGGYKIFYKNLVFDIWNVSKEEDIKLQLDIDYLFIDLVEKKFVAEVFNESIKSGYINEINPQVRHNIEERNKERILKYTNMFHLKTNEIFFKC